MPCWHSAACKFWQVVRCLNQVAALEPGHLPLCQGHLSHGSNDTELLQVVDIIVTNIGIRHSVPAPSTSAELQCYHVDMQDAPITSLPKGPNCGNEASVLCN